MDSPTSHPCVLVADIKAILKDLYEKFIIFLHHVKMIFTGFTTVLSWALHHVHPTRSDKCIMDVILD